MTLQSKNTESLRKVEDYIFRSRHIAGIKGDEELYGILDSALLRIQYFGMGLKLERDRRDVQ